MSSNIVIVLGKGQRAAAVARVGGSSGGCAFLGGGLVGMGGISVPRGGGGGGAFLGISVAGGGSLLEAPPATAEDAFISSSSPLEALPATAEPLEAAPLGAASVCKYRMVPRSL